MQTQSNLRGIVAMLLAVGFFSLMDGGLKQLSGHYPPMQVAALRGLSGLPLVMAWVLATGTVVGLLKIRWRLHLLRAGLSIMMLSAFAFALKQMPMTSAYAIFFVAPLLITALSVPMLGEHVGPRRWAAIAVGLVGVLVVLRPTGEGLFGWAGLAFALVAAIVVSPCRSAPRRADTIASFRSPCCCKDTAPVLLVTISDGAAVSTVRGRPFPLGRSDSAWVGAEGGKTVS